MLVSIIAGKHELRYTLDLSFYRMELLIQQGHGRPMDLNTPEFRSVYSHRCNAASNWHEVGDSLDIIAIKKGTTERGIDSR
jgi:hypothetical protein